MNFKVNIVQLPNKILRKKSHDVILPLSKEDDLLAQQMIYHVTDSIKEGSVFRPAVGVAAVQYGILKKMFFVHIVNEQDQVIFSDIIINPKIIARSKGILALSNGEGCLSVKETDLHQEGFINRSERIIVDAYSYYEKKVRRFDCKQFLAIVFQHELDHLEGKLFIDHINQKDPWKKEENLKIL